MAEFSAPKDLAAAAATGDTAAVEAYLAALKEFGARRKENLSVTLGMEFVSVATDRVVMRLPWRPELQRGGGIFHGGALMALADHVAGSAYNTDPRIAAAGRTGMTTDFSVSFLRAAEPGEAVVATGKVLRRGRNVTFTEVEICGEASGAVIAVCRATYVTVAREALPTTPNASSG